MTAKFVGIDHVRAVISGKRVAVVGSGPGCLDNLPGYIDSFDLVVRVNNYKTNERTGRRTDIYASFFGISIKKTRERLIRDGVKLCLCKCPNSQPIQSEWHRQNNKMMGVDFRWIYTNRKRFWFCDTYIPTDDAFLDKFNALDGHMPTSGFAALHDVLINDPGEVYMTGFDFFMSGVHNVNERWRPGRKDDPIGHRPDLEIKWIKDNKHRLPIMFDQRLQGILG